MTSSPPAYLYYGMSEIKLTSVIDDDDLIVNDVDSDEEDYDYYCMVKSHVSQLLTFFLAQRKYR